MLPRLDALRGKVSCGPERAFEDVLRQVNAKRAVLAKMHSTPEVKRNMVHCNDYLVPRGETISSVRLGYPYHQIGARVEQALVPLLRNSLEAGGNVEGRWNTNTFRAAIHAKEPADNRYDAIWYDTARTEADSWLEKSDQVFFLDVFGEVNGEKVQLCRYGFGFLEENGEIKTARAAWSPGPPVYMEALKQKCAQLFNDILHWDRKDTKALRRMVGEFLYYFTAWHPFERGSASLGIIFENLFYRFHHAVSLSYNHDYMVDLEAIADRDLETFLEGYLEKGFVTPPRFRF